MARTWLASVNHNLRTAGRAPSGLATAPLQQKESVLQLAKLQREAKDLHPSGDSIQSAIDRPPF